MRAIASLCVLLLLGCGSGGMKFLEKAQAAAPAFAAVGTSSQGLTVAKTRSALGGSAEINAMFQLLREYQFPRDEGKVDLTNLYKELHTFDDEGSSASGHCAAMREQTVAAPYDVGPGPTYTCLGDDVTGPGYRNGFALKVAGTTTSALLAFRWAPDATQQRSLGQIQGSFDTASQDVSFILVNLVEYPAGSTMGGATGNGFTVRTDLTGNAGTHRFTLRALVAGTDGANWTSLLGSGVSRGSGEHFLFKTSVASMMPGQAPKYFCLPSSIDEAGLQALDGQGASSVPSDCAHLSAAVEALSFLTLANAPVKASDFTGSDVGVGPAAP